MKILVTSATTRLSQTLAASLAASHEVLHTDRTPLSGMGQNFVRSGLGHDPSINDLVRGVDAIVHSGEPDSTASVSEQLDVAMRCTYNLLWAAAEEHVPRFVFLSSLRLMAQHDEELAVTERWRTVPSTDAIDLCYHLGEYTCREFAREGKIDVVCLRLGQLTFDSDAPPASADELRIEDAAQAVGRAVTAGLPPDSTSSRQRWTVLHIQSALPGARYLTTTAERAIGYAPSVLR